jgi:hypothetical protein
MAGFQTTQKGVLLVEGHVKIAGQIQRNGLSGVNIPTVNIDVSESVVNCAEPIKPVIQFGSISDNIEKNGTSVLAPIPTDKDTPTMSNIAQSFKVHRN